VFTTLSSLFIDFNLNYYVQRRLQEDGQVHLSALGVAISSLVTVAEIMKNKGLAVEKKIITLLETREDSEDSK
jgi:hypothetical protein